MRLLIFALLIISLFLPISVYCQDEVNRFLDEFEATRKEVKDLKAGFTQIKILALFEQEEKSQGTLYYKRPTMMLWEYEKPSKSLMLLRDGKASFYIPALEQVEIYDLDEKGSLSGFFLAFELSKDQLKDRFTIGLSKEKGLNRVILTPKGSQLSEQVQAVTLWLKQDDLLPRKVLIEEVNGDSTLVTFEKTSKNLNLSVDLFELKVPEGTEIIVYESSQER